MDVMYHARFLMRHIMGMTDDEIELACCRKTRDAAIAAGIREARHYKMINEARIAERQARTGDYGGIAGPVDMVYHGRN